MPVSLASIHVVGVFSALPAAGISGRLYFASDTGALWYDTGSAWVNTGTPFVEQVQQQALNFGTDSGAANAYAVALSPVPALVAGLRVGFKAANANTGASTLAVNGGAAVSLIKQGAALAAGVIVAGQVVWATYDGEDFQL